MRRLTTTLGIVSLLVLAACGGATTDTQQASNPAPAQPAATQEQATMPPAAEATAGSPQAQPPAPVYAQPAGQASRPAQPPIPRPTAPAGPQGYAPPKPTVTAHAPVPSPKPTMVELPAGTVIELELASDLSSKTNKEGDSFSAKVSDPVSMGGKEVIPAGSVVEGTVTKAVSAKQMSGQAVLSLQFTKLMLPDGQSVPISASLTEKGKKVGKRTAGIVGGSAAGGAVLGRIIGKDTKGAVVGALLGAAAGSGIAASQKGQELKLPTGTGMAIEIESAIQVPVPPDRA